MKRWFVMAVALLAGAAWAADDASTTHRSKPARGSFALMAGGYRPDIAGETGLSGDPYAQVLGNGSMLLVQMEIDRYFWNKVGSVGVGFNLGYGEKYGAATSSAGVTEEKTALKVLPLKLLGVYRFDYAAFKWGVPLVPYAKLGLAYTPWWVIKGGGVEYFNGQRGAGGKWGWSGELGLAVLLDVLEPGLALDFDTDVGVKHSYLFAEYQHDKVPGFGGDGLDLSSNHWAFGAAFDF
jgi:hypothetical protein